MAKQKSLTLNFMMNATLSMSSFLFPMLTFPYISRVLKPTGTGKVYFVTALVNYFAMFAQLGIPTYGIRACASVREDREKLSRTVHELLCINLIMNGAVYTVLWLSIALVPKLREEKPLCLIISSSIFLFSIGVEWLYKALEQYTYITIRSILFKLLALAAMFLLVHEESDYVIYGGISILASSASNLMNFANAHRYVSLRPVGDYDLSRHVKPVLVFFAMSCATTIYTNLDSVMLGFLCSDAEVGYYNTAVKVKVILVSIVTSLGAVLLPRASYFVKKGEMDQFRRISGKALHFVLLAAGSMMVYFMLMASECIDFLAGPLFENSTVSMQIIMPTLLFIGLSNILGIQILVPIGGEKVVLWSEIGGAVTDLILNALLIPRMGAAGAAIGTLAAEFVVVAYQYVVLCRRYRDIIDVRALLGEIPMGWITGSILVAAGASFAAGRLLQTFFRTDQKWWSFSMLLATSLVYFGIYGAMLLWRACRHDRSSADRVRKR